MAAPENSITALLHIQLTECLSYMMFYGVLSSPYVTFCITICTLVDSQLDTDSVSTYSDGRSVLRGSLYDPDSYPPSVICPVEIIFNSRPTNQSQHHAWQQHVWLWCHVTAQPTVWSIICKLFHGMIAMIDNPQDERHYYMQYSPSNSPN